jgi:hypothetical protein
MWQRPASSGAGPTTARRGGTSPSQQLEFYAVIPEVGDLRSRTALRLMYDDETQSRTLIEEDEVNHRQAIASHHVHLVTKQWLAIHGPKFLPRDAWERKTFRAFEVAESEQIREACSEYSPYNVDWMPHDMLRKLFNEWRRYYARWKRPYVMASALLSSFFCSMLIDDTLSPEHQIDLSREIVQGCLEITNDAEEDVGEVVSYTALCLLVKNLSAVLFAPKHPYVTTHLLAVILDERTHRAHE